MSSLIKKKNNRIDLSSTEMLNLVVASVLSALALLFYKDYAFIAAGVSLLYILFAITRAKDRYLFFVVFAMSNTHVLNVFGISASVAICMLAVLKFIFKGKKINSTLLLLIGIYIVYSLQYVIRYDDFFNGLFNPIKLSFVLLFFYFLSTDKNLMTSIYSDLPKIILFGTVGIVVNLLASSFILTEVARARVLNNDPNMLAVEATVMIAMSTVMYLKYHRMSLSVYAFILISMIGTVVLCGSRNGYLLLIIELVLAVVLNFTKTPKTFILLILLGIAAGLVFFTEAGIEAVETLLNRMEGLEGNDNFSNNRFEIWEEYITAFNSNQWYWLLGVGAYTNIGLKYQGHNGFIEDVAAYGLVGIFFIAWMVFIILITFHKTNVVNKGKRKIFDILPIIIIVIGSLTLRSLTNIINLSMLYMSLFFFTIENKEIKKHNEVDLNRHIFANEYLD